VTRSAETYIEREFDSHQSSAAKSHLGRREGPVVLASRLVQRSWCPLTATSIEGQASTAREIRVVRKRGAARVNLIFLDAFW